MNKLQKNKKFYCPVSLALTLVGGKWKALILWHVKDKPKRFSELKRGISPITEKMLIQQLRELESYGLIIRHAYPQIPPKVEYSLSPFAHNLIPILQMLCKFGVDYSKEFRVKIDVPPQL